MDALKSKLENNIKILNNLMLYEEKNFEKVIKELRKNSHENLSLILTLEIAYMDNWKSYADNYNRLIETMDNLKFKHSYKKY